MYYLLTSIILLVVYITLIILLSKVKKNKILNIIFPIIIFMCYIHSVYSIYKSVGFNDWNFQNTLPTANVSPFMFALVFLNFLFPHQFKKYIYTLVSYLSFGMVVAGLITMIYNYIREYNYYLNFVMDTVTHLLISLYGVYLYKTKQTYIEKNKMIKSILIIYVVAIIMVILNIIFKTSFFGLGLYGNHNIYNVVITKNSIVNLIIYFAGLTMVLLSGYIYQVVLNKIIYKES